MTESEAIEVVCREVGDSDGFVAHVERTGQILTERVASFLDAVDVLAVHWAGRSEVPKRAVVPLVDIFERIYAAAVAHESAYDEILQLGLEVYSRIDKAFEYSRDPRTEVGARFVLEQHFSSMAGIPFKLRARVEYKDGSVDEALTALKTLGEAWRDRDTIPITLAAVMYDIREAVQGTSGLYPEQQAEIEAVGDALGAAVIKCLS